MFYTILIRDLETDEIIEEISLMSSRGVSFAERVERGVNINLDHKTFYTEIIEENELPTKKKEEL